MMHTFEDRTFYDNDLRRARNILNFSGWRDRIRIWYFRSMCFHEWTVLGRRKDDNWIVYCKNCDKQKTVALNILNEIGRRKRETGSYVWKDFEPQSPLLREQQETENG